MKNLSKEIKEALEVSLEEKEIVIESGLDFSSYTVCVLEERMEDNYMFVDHFVSYCNVYIEIDRNALRENNLKRIWWSILKDLKKIDQKSIFKTKTQ